MKIFAHSYTCCSYHILSPLSNKSISVVWRGEKLSVGKYPSAPTNTSPQKIKNKKTPVCLCKCVVLCVCGQLQSWEFALQNVNMPDNTAVAGRLIHIQLLISSYMLITHQPNFIQNHLLIPFVSEHKANETADTLVAYGKHNLKFLVR